MPAPRRIWLVSSVMRPRLPVTSAAATAPACPPIASAIRRVSVLRALSIVAITVRSSGGGAGGGRTSTLPASEPTAPMPLK